MKMYVSRILAELGLREQVQPVVWTHRFDLVTLDS